MTTEKVMIFSTPAEIAEGLRMFLAEHQKPNIEPSFETDQMTVGKASKFSNVSYATFCKWINTGKIKVHGKGRTRFVLRSELINSLKNNE